MLACHTISLHQDNYPGPDEGSRRNAVPPRNMHHRIWEITSDYTTSAFLKGSFLPYLVLFPKNQPVLELLIVYGPSVCTAHKVSI
jgi:hypothetical protein